MVTIPGRIFLSSGISLELSPLTTRLIGYRMENIEGRDERGHTTMTYEETIQKLRAIKTADCGLAAHEEAFSAAMFYILTTATGKTLDVTKTRADQKNYYELIHQTASMEGQTEIAYLATMMRDAQRRVDENPARD